MKKKNENLEALMLDQVLIYGKEIDFFFMAASVTRANDPKSKVKTKRDKSLVRLQPEKI